MSAPQSTPPKELKAVFFHLVVRRASLASLPDGEEAFLSRFPTANLGQGISLWCAMSGQDIDPIIDALELEGRTDADYYIGVWEGLTAGLEPEGDTLLLCSWLNGRSDKSGIWVSLIE